MRRACEPTPQQWAHIFEMLASARPGSPAVQLACTWLQSVTGTVMCLRTFERLLRRERIRIAAEAATHAPPAVAMLHAVPLGASIVAEGVPVPGALKRTHEAALGSSDAPGWRAQVARMRGATPQQHKFKVDARMMSH